MCLNLLTCVNRNVNRVTDNLARSALWVFEQLSIEDFSFQLVALAENDVMPEDNSVPEF